MLKQLKYSNTNVLTQVIEAQVDMPIFGAVTLYSSLLTFTPRVRPDRLDYAQVLVCMMPKMPLHCN